MTEYLIEADVRATFRVTADSLEDALSDVANVIVASASEATRAGLSELSVDKDTLTVAEVAGEDVTDMDEPRECGRCRRVYDEATGPCPSCAAKSDDDQGSAAWALLLAVPGLLLALLVAVKVAAVLSTVPAVAGQ